MTTSPLLLQFLCGYTEATKKGTVLQPPPAGSTGTHIEVPEREDSDDHGCSGPAPATGTVEHKGCP